MTWTSVFQQFGSSFLGALVLNGLLIGFVFLLFYKYLYPIFQYWRIPTQQQWNRQQIQRELKNALFTLSVAAGLSCLMLYFSHLGYTHLYTNYQAYPIWSWLSFFVLLILDDAWFYWVHRLLHHPKLYRHIHLEHHKSVDVIPSTALSFHWLEPLLLTLWIVPASFVLPIYAPILGLVQLWGTLDNIKSHLGMELYPAWWNTSWLRWLTSSTHHNLHHSQVHGNYGVHFRWWDRWMGTEFDHYEATFDAVQQRKQQGTNNAPPTSEVS